MEVDNTRCHKVSRTQRAQRNHRFVRALRTRGFVGAVLDIRAGTRRTMKVGANSVVFVWRYPLEQSIFRYRAGWRWRRLASAIDGMSEHLLACALARTVPEIKQLAETHGSGVAGLSEQPSRRRSLKMTQAAQAAADILPTIIWLARRQSPDDAGEPGAGFIDRSLGALADAGRTLRRLTLSCYSAFMCGQAVYNTPTTLRMMEAFITSPGLWRGHGPVAHHTRRQRTRSVRRSSAATRPRPRPRHARQGRGQAGGFQSCRKTLDLVGYPCPARERIHRPPDLRLSAPKRRCRAVLCHRRRVARAHAGVLAGVRRALRSRNPARCGQATLGRTALETGQPDQASSAERVIGAQERGRNGGVLAPLHCRWRAGDTIEP